MDIEKLYKSNPIINKSDVKLLKTWMENQPHLPETDESMIIILLNACEVSLVKSKKCIEYYYTIRSTFPVIFTARDPELPMNIQGLNTLLHEPFPELSSKGHGVFYAKLMDTSPDKFDFCTAVKLFDLRVHAWLREVGCVNGIEIIFDMEGISWRHWQSIGFMNLKRSLGYLMEAFPVRLRAIHVVNPINFLKIVLVVMHTLCSNEFNQCIRLHSNIETLSNELPKMCIPDHLHGSGGSIEKLYRKYLDTMNMNKEYFIEDGRCKSDESKRVRAGYFKQFGLS